MNTFLRSASAAIVLVTTSAATPPPPLDSSAPFAASLDFSGLRARAGRPNAPQGVCDPDGAQASGAVYRICMPSGAVTWNNDLVVYAHGYVPVTYPIAIPEDQLAANGESITETLTGLGYAFATTSYSVNGLAIREGISDVIDLVGVFSATYGQPNRVILVGVSEGALVTTLAVEQHPDVFDGGLAACGPIGDFNMQINHFGDVRVVFDYYFSGAIPPSPISIPPWLVDNTVWSNWIAQTITQRLTAFPFGPINAQNLINVMQLPLDPSQIITSAGYGIVGNLSYNVLGTNDAVAKLGGNPYDNHARVYSGTGNPFSDALLNSGAQRFTADVTATQNISAYYQTSGDLARPLVTIHTTGDPIVKVVQASKYRQKVLAQGRAQLLTYFEVNRFGHCSFTADDVLLAFNALLARMNIPGARMVFVPNTLRDADGQY